MASRREKERLSPNQFSPDGPMKRKKSMIATIKQRALESLNVLKQKMFIMVLTNSDVILNMLCICILVICAYSKHFRKIRSLGPSCKKDMEHIQRGNTHTGQLDFASEWNNSSSMQHHHRV